MSVTAEARAATVELPPLPDGVIARTRFGTCTFTADHRVYMPKGPLGFQDYHDFALANLAHPEVRTFKLLQSLDEPDLSFIVTTLPQCGGPIAEADLEEIAAVAGVSAAEAMFLLIVTVRPNPDGEGIVTTVNLRAPIVLDPATRLARQCAISNQIYPLRQPVSSWDGGRRQSR